MGVGDNAVLHGALLEGALVALNADVDQRFGAGLEVAPSPGGYADHRTGCDVEHLVADFHATLTRKDDVHLLILHVVVEEGHCLTGFERTEREFATGGAERVFEEFFATEGGGSADGCVGEMFASENFVHNVWMFEDF